jgi:hypothetical protein
MVALYATVWGRPMRDILLQCSGLLAIAAAIIHGTLTEIRLFPRVTIEPQRQRTLFRLVFQLPTVAWIACGVLLIVPPSMGSESARHWMIVAFACLFVFSAVVNAWGTRGRHFGWVVLGVVAALAVGGY